MQYPIRMPCLVGNLQIDKRGTINAEMNSANVILELEKNITRKILLAVHQHQPICHFCHLVIIRAYSQI
jgi:hypothetical protein